MGCSCGVHTREECQAMHDIALVKEIENNQYAVHRIRSFTYGLQHPDIYLLSGKTFATNLIGVCIAVEFNNDQNLFNRILQGMGKLKNNFETPALPESFGVLNISHLMDAKNAHEYELFVQEWAEDVWKAYQIHHDLANHWILKFA